MIPHPWALLAVAARSLGLVAAQCLALVFIVELSGVDPGVGCVGVLLGEVDLLPVAGWLASLPGGGGGRRAELGWAPQNQPLRGGLT